MSKAQGIAKVGAGLAILGVLWTSAAARADDSPVMTYNRDVAPLFQAKCQACHHPGTIAPMSLMTFEEVRPWVKAIRKAISDGTMPPWDADPRHGHFKNDTRLSEEEKGRILAWVAQGAQPGDAKDHPPALVFASEWAIGEPDHILKMPVEFTVKADMKDEYKYFNITADLPEDAWVQAIEFKPGNRKVVHHIIANPIGGWAPGTPPSIYEAPMARLLPKGQVIRLQMHYHNETGEDQTDRSMIGFKIAHYPVTKQVRTEGIANWRFLIPAGADRHPVSAEYTFDRDASIRSLMPHMHLRGKDMTIAAEFPDGKKETLLAVPKYDFNWQMVYEFAEPLHAPKGTKILVDSHFDNSAANSSNPDPAKTVHPGEATTDEMMIGFMQYTLDEEDIQAGKAIAQKRGFGAGRGDRKGRGGFQLDADRVLKRMDRDGDGFLSGDEIPERLQAVSGFIDKNGDGKLSAEELKGAQEMARERRGGGEKE